MNYPNSIYFTDSKDYLDQNIHPKAAERLLEQVSHPAYRWGNQKLISALMDAAHMPPQARKSYASNTVIGMEGLTYAVCEQVEYGYGIFTGYTDDEYLMTWLNPQLFFQQERLVFKVIDWTTYLRNAGQRGSSATWACAVGEYTDIPVVGCELNYCFEPDRHNIFGIPAGTRPSDVTEPCITQPMMNILGRRITDRVQLREFALMWGVRLHMLDRLFNGNYCASTVGDNGQEDGVLSWFDNFAARHQYLAQDCMTALEPTTTVTPTTAAALSTALGYTVTDTAATIAAAQVEFAVRTISQHIIDVEYKVRDISGGGAVGFNQIGVLMNPVDAQCMVWYQFCQAKCSGSGTFDVAWTGIEVSSFTQLNQWYADFQARMRGGLYGGGVLRLHDGREISMMPLTRIPQGTVLVLVKGWGGSVPNPYGFRLAGMQYNQWYSHVSRTLPSASLRYRLAMNGTMVRFEPTDACGDIEMRWNQRLFSNAPWMQLKITGLPPCSDVSIPTWPTMPALTTYSRCTPPGCEILV